MPKSRQNGTSGRLVELLPTFDLSLAAPATQADIALELAQLDAGVFHRANAFIGATSTSVRQLLFIQGFVRLFSIVTLIVLLG